MTLSKKSTKAEHTTFWRQNDDSTPTFEQVGDVYGMTAATMTRGTDEETPYGNLSSTKKSSASGLLDHGSQEFTVRYKKSNPQAMAMIEDVKNDHQTDRKYQLRINDDEKSLVLFTSIVTAAEQSFEAGYINLKFTLVHNDRDDTGVWS